MKVTMLLAAMVSAACASQGLEVGIPEVGIPEVGIPEVGTPERRGLKRTFRVRWDLNKLEESSQFTENMLQCNYISSNDRTAFKNYHNKFSTEQQLSTAEVPAQV